MQKYFLSLVSIVFFSSSCLTKIALNSIGVFEKSVQLKYITNGNKKLVFLPMHHVGTSEFYKDEKKIVDSLIANGYSVFYEAVKSGNVTDSLIFDTMKLKFRKITGLPKKTKDSTNIGKLVDTVNNTIFGRKSKLVKKYNLKNQSVQYFKKYDSLLVKNVDANLIQMITIFEEKYGIIQLDKNDFETKIGDGYKFKKNKERRNYVVLESRNTIISNAILKSKSNKIALIYGKAHYNGILKNLQAEDKNFKEVDKF